MADGYCYWPSVRSKAAVIGFSSHAYADLTRQLDSVEPRFHRLSVKAVKKQEKVDKLIKLRDAESHFLGSDSDEEEEKHTNQSWYETFGIGIPDMKFRERIELEDQGLVEDGGSLDELIAAATEKYENANKEAADCECLFMGLAKGKEELSRQLDALEKELLKDLKSNKLEAWVKLVGFSDLSGIRFIKKMNKEGKLKLELLFCLGKKTEAGMPQKLAELSEDAKSEDTKSEDRKIVAIKRGCLYRLKVDGVIEVLTKEEMEAVGFPTTTPSN